MLVCAPGAAGLWAEEEESCRFKLLLEERGGTRLGMVIWLQYIYTYIYICIYIYIYHIYYMIRDGNLVKI